MMALPSIRTMPTIPATYDDVKRAWIVELPGRLTLEAQDEGAVAILVSKYAPGSAIRWLRITESEQRAVAGDR